MSKQSDIVKVSQDAGTTGFVNTTGDTMTGTLSVTGGRLRVGQTAGDYAQFGKDTGGNAFIDATQADADFGIYINSTSTGYNKKFGIDSAGRVTMPYQPAAFGRFTTITSPTTNYVVGLSDVTARGGMVVSSNRITVPVSGYYLVHAHQLISTSSSNYFHIRINGTTDTYAYVNVDDTEDEAVQTIVNLSANDYIDFYMTNASYTWGSTHSSWFVTLLG